MARILVVDDEELVRFALCTILEDNGHEVEEAANGNECLEVLKKAPAFDIAIVDIFMPEKEGTETILELRRDYPDLKLIAISGGGQTGDLSYLKVAKTFGADMILPKPLTESDVVIAVNSLLT
ncbi:response regulator [Pseudomonadota bacterium]